MKKETLGGRLRRLRHARGLTIEQVADLIGYSKSRIQQWETNFSPPTDDGYRILEEFYGVMLRGKQYYTETAVERMARRKLLAMAKDAGVMSRGLSVLGISPEAVAGLEL